MSSALRVSAKHAELTAADIRSAEQLIERALRPRALPNYSPEERLALAVLVADYSRLQRARGKRSKGAAKDKAKDRRFHVELLLRYVVGERYRKKPTTLATIMKIVDWLDRIGIEASEPQVRRDIHAALRSGPLAT
jgi:hypothetical protein